MFLARCRLLVLAVSVVVSLFASTAAAHFVWIETLATPTGLLVRSGFGEPDGWDPDLIDRMQKSTFQLQTIAGPQPLSIAVDPQEKEYRTTVEGKHPSAVTAACDFGVIAFGGNPPSWLRYTAKSLVGPADRWNDASPTPEMRIEMLAAREGDLVTLRVLHLGKPLAGATIKATPPIGDKIELKTDADGTTRWPLAGSGLYACYVGTTTMGPGEHDGKQYESLKDYTTLTFRME